MRQFHESGKVGEFFCLASGNTVMTMMTLMCCRQAEIQHKVVEDVHRLLQLSADSSNYR